MTQTQAPPARTPLLPMLALVLCAALWSLGGPIIKLLSHDPLQISGFTVAFYRSLFGGLFFLPFALRRWRSIPAIPVGWATGAVASFTIMTGAFVIATMKTAAATAILLQYTSPIWVFALSPLLLGEKPRASEAAALAVALVGIVAVLIGHPPESMAGLLIALLSGFGYGALTVALRGLRAAPPTLVVVMNSLGSALLLAPAVALFGVFELTGRQTLMLLILGFVPFMAPYAIFSWALRYVEAHKAALVLLLETVLNPVFTYLAVGERPPAATLMGAPFILAGVVGWMVVSARPRSNTNFNGKG